MQMIQMIRETFWVAQQQNRKIYILSNHCDQNFAVLYGLILDYLI